jgi:hypothetical protein
MNSFKVLLELAGLELSNDEILRLKPYYELYVDALKDLYNAELQHEEVAGSFIPAMEEKHL